MIEIGRTGLRLTTAIAIESGQAISLTLRYREETVEIRGVVRWSEPAPPPDDDDAPLASWEVGVAFSSIGEVSEDGIWRGLTPYREARA